MTNSQPLDDSDIIKDFDEVSNSYHAALTSMLQAKKEMEDAKFQQEVMSAQCEFEVAQAAGDEKKVGANEFVRKRVYDIARSKHTGFLATRDQYNSAYNDYQYHKHMVRLLDLHLQFLKELAGDK